MDKETLSNYGWIVIAVLVLAVMIALATPFGNFVATAAKNTVQGLFGTNQNALNAAGIVIGDQNFDETGTGGGIDEPQEKPYDHDAPELHPNGIIPEGAIYKTADGTTYNAGEPFPETNNVGDIYRDEAYEYAYNKTYWASNGWYDSSYSDGWGVRVLNKKQTEYPAILESINNKPVVDLSWLFYECSNLEIAPAIPKGTLSLGSTFRMCRKLKTVPIIPEGVQTCACAFMYCSSLPYLPNMPSTVTDMNATFQYCTQELDLKDYIIPDGVTDVRQLFEGCYNLKSAPVLPENVTMVWKTFGSCVSLTGTVTINANASSINEYCFDSVDFQKQKITLAGTSTKLDKMGATGINYCKDCNGYCVDIVEQPKPDLDTALNHSVIIPEGGTYKQHINGEWVNGKWNGDIITYTAGDKFPTTKDPNAIYYYGNYQYKYSVGKGWSVSINPDVTTKNEVSYGVILESIKGEPIASAYQCFYGCTQLEVAPIIPSTVTNINYMFGGCTNLKSYTGSTDVDGDLSNYVIPNGVTDMQYAFSNCSSLTKAPAIPGSVTSWNYAFENCTSLTETPIICEGVKKMPYVFKGCTALKTVKVIPSTMQNMERAFYGCSSLVNVPNIPNGVTNMANTFYQCTSLVNAPALPSTVTDLRYTFYGCTSLKTAPVIPASATNCQGTFSSCTSLSGTIEINSNATYPNSVFYGVDFEVQNITLTGTSTTLDKFGASGTNYCTECNGKCQNNH